MKNIEEGISIGIIILLIGASAFLGIVGTVSADINEGLVGYWSFDDSSNPGHDDSGNNNDGTLFGSTWVDTGISGGGVSYDGIDDYVEIPHDPSLDTNNAFSVLAWFKSTGTNTFNVNTIMTRRGPGYQYSFSIYDHYDDGNYYLYGMTEQEGVGVNTLYSEPDYVDLDNWYFGVYTYDGSNYRLYLGDETTVWEVDNELNSPIEPPSMDVSLFLGSNKNSGGFFKGLIDEVRVYNRALSFEDIEDIHDPPDNDPPIADAGGPYSGDEGVEITFDASGSYDPDGNIVGYRWDWTNNDEWDTPWLTSPIATHTYPDEGSYTVLVEVKDNQDSTNTDTAQVTIIGVVCEIEITYPKIGYINWNGISIPPPDDIKDILEMFSIGVVIGDSFDIDTDHSGPIDKVVFRIWTQIGDINNDFTDNDPPFGVSFSVESFRIYGISATAYNNAGQECDNDEKCCFIYISI